MSAARRARAAGGAGERADGGDAALLAALETRFAANMARHAGIAWTTVRDALAAAPHALAAVAAMERTGGEPDVVGRDEATGRLRIVDCAAESPLGRRSLCYDDAALDARREAKPAGSAVGMAAAMGIALLDEAGYAALQRVGEFDRKTSSWLATPPAVRALGGALFGDRRYGRVFTYHNGAQSYYAVRGFRGVLLV